MAVGYVAKSGSDTTGMSYDAMLYCKTNIGGYFFDGFMSVEHTRELEMTENPVETGASVIDHAYVKPAEVTMQIKMSDVHQSLVAGQFSDGRFRSTSAWKVLKTIQDNRIPVTVFTRLGLYENMMIQTLSATDDSSTFRSLNATVKLKELPVARVRTIKISKASSTTDSTALGNIQASTTDQSVLSMLMGWLNGGTG